MAEADEDAIVITIVATIAAYGSSSSYYSAAATHLAEVDVDVDAIAITAAANPYYNFIQNRLRNHAQSLHISRKNFIYFDNVSFWRYIWKIGTQIK